MVRNISWTYQLLCSVSLISTITTCSETTQQDKTEKQNGVALSPTECEKADRAHIRALNFIKKTWKPTGVELPNTLAQQIMPFLGTPIIVSSDVFKIPNYPDLYPCKALQESSGSLVYLAQYSEAFNCACGRSGPVKHHIISPLTFKLEKNNLNECSYHPFNLKSEDNCPHKCGEILEISQRETAECQKQFGRRIVSHDSTALRLSQKEELLQKLVVITTCTQGADLANKLEVYKLLPLGALYKRTALEQKTD